MQQYNEDENQLLTSNLYIINQSQNLQNNSQSSYENSTHSLNKQAIVEQFFYNIADINNPSIEIILTTLHKIFQQENNYVDLGHNNLISLNPFKGDYHLNDQQIQEYIQKNKNNQYPQPHLFKLIELAKKACFNNKNTTKTSSIIIQGNSGSGKTVAFNNILSYIALESKSVQSTQSVPCKVDIEKRITSTNIILEAFGNAKTISNSNSSRFGKILSIQFDEQGKIRSGNIITILFERSRVIQQRFMERNYNIFYQLFIAYKRIEELKNFAQQTQNPVIIKLVEEIQKLKLDSYFAIFGDQNNINVDNESDLEIQKQTDQDLQNFKQLLLAFGYLNFSFEEILSIIQCIAGLIHLYENKFNEAQELLQIPNLQETINSQIDNLQQSKKLQVESIIKRLIIDLYYKLFYLIQDKINNNLLQKDDQNQLYTLNIFDSFGLEIIEDNNEIQQNEIEQLMSNYINEKLQNSYYTKIIDNANKLFNSENLNPIVVNFKKNDDIIELFEQVIFNCLNVCISQQINNNSLEEMIKKQSQEKGYQNIFIDQSQSKINSNNIFGIKHTGSEIYYKIDNLINSIKYPVCENIQNINKLSNNSIIKSFTIQSQNQTLIDDTQKFINNWINIFKQSDTFYVKCLQTNYKQQINYFDQNAIQIQLRQSGIEQSASFLYQSYLLSFSKNQFLQHYKSKYPKIKNEDDLKAFLCSINDNQELIYFGQNNILIKDNFKRNLDQKSEQYIENLLYQGSNNIINKKIEELEKNFNQLKRILVTNINIVDKEIKFQRSRADLLEQNNKEIMTLMKSQNYLILQQMEQIVPNNLFYMNQIQNINQPQIPQNQEQGNILRFGHIQ